MKLKYLLLEILSEAISDSAKKKAKEKFKNQDPNLTDEQIDYYINIFSEKQSSPKFVKKDIMQYKFDELEKIIDANFPRKEERGNSDEVDFKGSQDVVYNKNGLLVLLGDTKPKCIRYGKGYSYCISRTDASNMFFSYRMRLNEPAFYFIFDEDKPKTDIWHAMVVYINKDGQYSVASSKNTGDENMSWDEIVKIQPKLKNVKSLIKHIPLSSQERDDYNKYGKKVSDDTYKNFTYDEKEKYIGFSHDLSLEQIKDTPKPLLSKYAVTTTGENITPEIEKTLPSADRKKLKDNRIQVAGNAAMFIYYAHEFEEGHQVDGDLKLDYRTIKSLPKGLKVGGNLDLTGADITSLSNGLKVGGDLNLSGATIKSFPNGLEVGGNLDLMWGNIESLPKDLKVGGHLTLYGSKITSLPNGLKVGGDLDLRSTKIESLPNDLEVGGDLDLSGTNVTSLPNYLKVGGNLDLKSTKIESLPIGLNVGGNLNLSNNINIDSLPKGLKVGGSLYASKSSIKHIPSGIEIGDSMYLKNTLVSSIPRGLKIRGELELSFTNVTSLPDDLKVGGMLDLMSTPLAKKYRFKEDQLKKIVPGIKGEIWGLRY